MTNSVLDFISKTKANTSLTEAPITPAAVSSKYINVYPNEGRDLRSKPYRVSIRTNQLGWQSFGNFKCQHVAAMVQNIQAAVIFNGKPMLNPVDTDAMDTQEWEAWENENRETVRDAHLIIQRQIDKGHVPRMAEPRG